MSGKHNAIVLLSGGLDSTLAVKMMIDQEDRYNQFTRVFCNCILNKLKDPHIGTK
jgi:tRNA U34 2-thiouridine synthase MnmA/TrmU